MPYVLGIHLGATATSAAVARRSGGRWGQALPVPLGSETPTVPTVLCRVQDGSFVAGEPARKQEVTHHEWVVRAFTRALGDDSPLLVGSEFVPAQQLVATMIEWVADTVAQHERHPPEHITVAHSATWGPYRSHLVNQALSRLGLTDVALVPEPVAVGLDYANNQAVEENGVLAVGNVGGSGFDATVLRRRAPGFEIVGAPLDSGHPGGQDLDDEVFGHLRSELGDELVARDLSDVQERAALAGLRAECTRAKEALSYQPQTTVRVELPRVRTEVALSRTRYEQLARTHLERVPDLLLQAVQSAGVDSEQLDALVLAGGTARSPLVKQLVTERLHQPRVDAAPELVAARGAALSSVDKLSTSADQQGRGQGQGQVDETNVLVRVEGSASDSGGVDRRAADPLPAPRPPVEVRPMHIEPPDEDRQRAVKIIKLCVAAVLILGGLVLTIVQNYPESGSSGPSVLHQQK